MDPLEQAFAGFSFAVENEESTTNPSNSKNCLINLSSGEENISEEVNASTSPTKPKDAKLIPKCENQNEQASSSDFDQRQELGEAEPWWPVQNLNEEWGLPKTTPPKKYVDAKKKSRRDAEESRFGEEWMKDEVSTARSLLKKTSSSPPDYFNTRSTFDINFRPEREDRAETKRIEEETETEPKLIPIYITKRVVRHEETYETFRKLTFGKDENRKTYIVPKSMPSIKIYVDCTPSTFEGDLMKYIDAMPSGGRRGRERHRDLGRDDEKCSEKPWILYKTTCRTITQLPPKTHSTFSYEISYEHVIYIPENGPDVELYSGTVQQQ